MHFTPPVFIPTSPELKIFQEEKSKLVKQKLKVTNSQINTAFYVIKDVLYRRYGIDYSVTTFVEHTNSIITESDIISKYIRDVFNNNNWAYNTKKTIFYIIKTLFRTIAINSEFINRLSFSSNLTLPRYSDQLILPKKYYNLPDSNPVKLKLKEWINIIRAKTNNKSPSSIKSMITFFLNICLPVFNLTLEYWDITTLELSQEMIDNIATSSRNFKWVKIFCIEILNRDFPFSFLKHINPTDKTDFASGDPHVIPKTELEKIYEVVTTSSLFDHILFILLLTTGMRIGGMIHIRLPHIATITDNTISIFNIGRTLEKGNKWFEFVISDKLKVLLIQWINNERKNHNDYLFPSAVTRSGHISDNTVRNRFRILCKKADLHGKHLHLHSLRHSYAHLLLKCGNKISDISKLLNHSNTHTTEQFYLRESVTEVLERANIPWLNPSNLKNPPENPIPNFLRDRLDHNKKTKRKIQRLQSINLSLSSVGNQYDKKE